MVKKIFFCAVLAGVSSFSMAALAASSNSLNDYQAVKSALSGGKAVTLVTTFDHCQGQRDGKPRSIKLVGGLQINSFLIPDDKYIIFSDYHQRLSDKEGVPEVEFTRYKIMPDNHLVIETRRYVPATSSSNVTHEANFSPVSWNCEIGSGAQFYTAQ
ncbi:VirK family protein [Erwinia psidii]|uniref:VirK protein n=1 Tax=Erwinia psidii TaxID=69224 RepID=A0A3N6SFH9_9GAMM|nr:VirK family protein [Erwinia psidii]MCX8956695.1 VirK protein [Erwinia psidii]MCX8960494.1 VirK protein [Erwinia psidii]MCX8964323.1 VirK protein [Erwinia psidii]RQM40240.1 VirK protein [Erwinia psidii]